eukprot:439881-Rhodomonas_salina.1
MKQAAVVSRRRVAGEDVRLRRGGGQRLGFGAPRRHSTCRRSRPTHTACCSDTALFSPGISRTARPPAHLKRHCIKKKQKAEGKRKRRKRCASEGVWPEGPTVCEMRPETPTCWTVMDCASCPWSSSYKIAPATPYDSPDPNTPDAQPLNPEP